jgi:hypothetical protein
MWEKMGPEMEVSGIGENEIRTKERKERKK